MKLTSLKTSELVAEPGAGSNLVECSWEAAWLALENEIRVSFVFNGQRYAVEPSNIIDCVRLKEIVPK